MKLFIFLAYAFCISYANANEYVQSSRYVDIDVTPLSSQVDPLSVVIDFSFPQEIQTVGEAIYLLISPSGYQINVKENDIAYFLFEMPLPEVHRHLGPMRFKQAVKVLSGVGFIPNFDESIRHITFTTNSDSVNAIDISSYKESWEARQKIVRPVITNHVVNNITSKGFKNYKVQAGDSISIIANKLGVIFTERFKINVLQNNSHAFINSNPDLLMAGKTIKVPML